MNYSSIKYYDTADGLGIRTALFVSGCRIHCPGCHNSEAWDFKAGKEFTEIEMNEILESLKPDYIAGLSILGGEPTEYENAETVANIILKVKEVLPNKNIWIYSGRTLEKLRGEINSCYHNVPDCPEYYAALDTILSTADILVDGPFIEAQRDISLKFRGSPNQRIIDLKSGRVLDPETLW